MRKWLAEFPRYSMATGDAKRSARATVQGAGRAASLAHEINNPLDCLLVLLDLLETEATLTPQGHNYLRLAKEEVRRISQMTQAALYKRESPTAPRVTNVSELLRSVVDFYTSWFAARGISISARYCPMGDLRVYPGPLRQAFCNLMLNAAASMPAGGTVYARVRSAHESSGRRRHGLRVTFADNGCGIPAKDLPRISECFFTTKGSAGSGLGLALVKATVRKHAGVLRVRSTTRPGRSGSVFAMFLPAALR